MTSSHKVAFATFIGERRVCIITPSQSGESEKELGREIDSAREASRTAPDSFIIFAVYDNGEARGAPIAALLFHNGRRIPTSSTSAPNAFKAKDQS